MVKYINMKSLNEIETVDEFPFNTKEERKECRRCLNEYRICDSQNEYYLSQRATKSWAE